MRNNDFKLGNVKEFLQDIKDQPYLEMLVLDKEYCENSEICAAKEKIRAKNNKFSITNKPKY